MMHSHRTLLVCSLVVMLAMPRIGDRSALADAVGTASNPLVIATSRFHGFLPAYRVAEKLKDQGIYVKIIEFRRRPSGLKPSPRGMLTCRMQALASFFCGREGRTWSWSLRRTRKAGGWWPVPKSRT